MGMSNQILNHPIIKKLNKICPMYAWLPLIFELLFNSLVYWGARPLVGNRTHYLWNTPIDDVIPMVAWTITIYFGSYIFWGANYILGGRQSREEVYRFCSADFLAKIICLFFFVAFPTTIIRPEITGTGFWNDCMRFLYQADAADNLFPSIHCLTSWFCCIAVRKQASIPKWYIALSYLITFAICISTLTTRQHVLVDVFGGIFFAEFCYQITERIGFAKHYANTFERINHIIKNE